MNRKLKLTNERIKGLPDATQKYIAWDTECKGLGAWVLPRHDGKRTISYFVTYRMGSRLEGHREQKQIIGRHGELCGVGEKGVPQYWNPDRSRKEATRIKVEVAKAIEEGTHPKLGRRNTTGAKRVSDLWTKYLDEIMPTKSDTSISNETVIWNKYIVPKLGKILVKSLVYEDVEKLHRDITKAGSPIQANRMHAHLKAALNQAIKWRWIDHNPANGLKRNPEVSRQRYADDDEIEALWNAITNLKSKNASDALALLLLTGARKGEVFSARWNDFDLKKATWTKSAHSTKQRRLHHLPLSSEAVEILRRRHKDRDPSCPWVFPAATGNGYMDNCRKAWERVCEAANLEDFRIHDLRHTFGSRVVTSTGSLPLTGSLLGHTSPRTTQRYAHLLVAAQRDATESVGQILRGKTSKLPDGPPAIG